MFETITSTEDYLQYSGEDLQAELETLTGLTDGNLAPRFIYGVEQWCKDYLMLHYDYDGVMETEHQRKQWIKGIVYQIDYIRTNGNISLKSGLNLQTGSIIPRKVLDELSLGQDALMAFRLGGMANLMRF